MLKKLFLVSVLMLAFFSFAFAGSTIVTGSGPMSVTTGGDVELAKILITYIANIENVTISVNAAANTWTANVVQYIGLLAASGQVVELDSKSEYGSLIARNMYGQHKAYRTDNIKHDLLALYEDGIWIDAGTATISAIFLYDFVQTKQSDMNYDDNK